MEAVWIAFACGIFIGLVLGVLFLGLVSINKENKWKSEGRREQCWMCVGKYEILFIQRILNQAYIQHT